MGGEGGQMRLDKITKRTPTIVAMSKRFVMLYSRMVASFRLNIF
jgi:hypothetical protein